MNVIIRTNIDVYNTNMFPYTFADCPRKGEMIQVTSAGAMRLTSINKLLPHSLEVKSVIWTQGDPIIDLHFSNYQLETFRIHGINPYKC